MTSHPKVSAMGIALALALALASAGCTTAGAEPAGDFSFDHFRGVEVGADWADVPFPLGQEITGGGSCGNYSWQIESDDDLKWYVVINVSHPYADGEADLSTGVVESFLIGGIPADEMSESWLYNEPGFAFDGDYWSDAPTTDKGIRLGSTADDIYRAYPNATLIGPYDPVYGESVIRATDGSGNAMDFALAGDIVLGIEAGPIAVIDAPQDSCT